MLTHSGSCDSWDLLLISTLTVSHLTAPGPLLRSSYREGFGWIVRFFLGSTKTWLSSTVPGKVI